jgi:hypothetical protein
MTFTKPALLTLAIAGCLATAHDAQAAVASYTLVANAPAHCQAFTPGPSNTVRNRVVGSENVGTAMNIACTFEMVRSSTSSNVNGVTLWFSNNLGGTINVSCTLLTGYQGMSGAVVLNKTVPVTVGVQNYMFFSATDTSNPADSDLGNTIVGVNCTLPQGAVINDTYINWTDENGVGS